MSRISELAVTLSADLYDHLVTEARQLDVPLEWLVASLAVDTFGEEGLTLQGRSPRRARSHHASHQKAPKARGSKTLSSRQARA